MSADGAGRGLSTGGGLQVEDDRVLTLIERLVDGDSESAWALLQASIAKNGNAAAVYLELMIPALRAIGDAWELGILSVGQEHVASVISANLIGRLGSLFDRRGPSRGWVVLGAPPGEEHGIPCSILSDLIRHAGFDVVNLGANAPARSFAEAAMGRHDVRAVLVGATTSWRAPAVRHVILTLRQADVPAPVLVGGHAIANRDHARNLGADDWSGQDAASAIAAVERVSEDQER